jgi:hypothetical protein
MNNFWRVAAKRWLAVVAVAAICCCAALVVAWPRSNAKSVLVAAHDIAEGSVLKASDLTRVSMNLGGSQSLYPSAVATGVVTLHRLVAGELIARDVIAPSATQSRLALVIEFRETLPSAVRVGAPTDIWATPNLNQTAGEPVPVGLDCLVGGIHQSSGLGQHSTAVELLCAPEYLPQLLRAKASGETISLIPQPSLLDQ